MSLWQPLRMYSKPSPEEKAFERKIKDSDREYAKNAPLWVKRDQSLKKRYGSWNPTRKLTRQQILDIRDLKQRMPSLKTVEIANFFLINPENIRRILKSKWTPTEEEFQELEGRAEKRKAKIREKKAAEMDQASKGSTVVKVKSLIAQRQREQKHLVERTQGQGRKKRDDSRRKNFTPTVGDLID